MRILAVDIGTGTQDILLYDSDIELENCFKLVLPSPTMILHRRLKKAARQGQPVLLAGVTMGGGPSQWGVEALLQKDIPLYATPAAARSFNDDLEAVAGMGVRVVDEHEARRLPADVLRLEMRDFDLAAITSAFAAFGVSLDGLAAAAVAVFDHGNAPPGISDRQFRFDYLDRRIRAVNRLSAFAYPAGDIPASMTRMAAIRVSAAGLDAPLVLMDTAPAAVLGACCDPAVDRPRLLVTNIGNFHTLAFRLGPEGIEGVFEHHTGLLDKQSLEELILRLADGSLRHADVFEQDGHGARVYSTQPFDLSEGDYGIVLTGPRRAMLTGSTLRPRLAAPFGDMMLAGCVGLVAACADVLPELAGSIRASLSGKSAAGRPPWEVEAD